MADQKDFLIESKDLDKSTHVVVTYRLETAGDFLEAAVALSKEQSFSAFEDPVKEKELIARYAAKVVVDSVVHIGENQTPSLTSYVHQGYAGTFVTREVQLAYPVALFDDSLVSLINMVIGEVHNIAQFTGIKVTDIDFPPYWLKRYQGPAFGIEGIRAFLGKEKGPLLISPVKPCVGLAPQEFADRVYECLMGGFDGVKDDELLLDPPYCSFEERVTKTMERVRQVEKETGKKKIYFANVGGDVRDIDRMVSFALKQGVGGIMFSPLVNGLDIIQKYKGKVPIISHNNLTYGMARHPLLGVSFSLITKIERLCGADMAICPAPDRSFYVMDYETHRENVNACVSQTGMKMTLAGLSGSQTPETLYAHGKFLGHDNFAICPGGAVYEHPQGIRSGALSFVEAVEALVNGIDLQEYAKKHEALATSLKHFSKKSKFDR